MSKKDLYKVLGVSRSASPDEIKKAYRRLAKKYHPDAHPGDKTAEEKFKEVSQAYDILGSPEKRKQYDAMASAFSRGPSPGGFDFGGIDLGDLFGSTGARPGGGGQSFYYQDISGMGGLGDLFSGFMDLGDFIRQSRAGPRKGSDIRSRVAISSRQAENGGTVRLKIRKTDNCAECRGSGAFGGGSGRACSECGGSGMIAIAKGGFGIQRPCPRCYGRGAIIDDPCRTCGGTGRGETTRTVSLKIPPGIRDGRIIRVKGQGNPGTRGAPPGDLLVGVSVRPSPEPEGGGKNLRATITIGLATAARGGKVRLRQAGKSALLTIPPRTRPGTVFRLKGGGSGRPPGDLLVKVDVKIPERPTAEEKELIEMISRRAGGR